jgi:hypothetical protein
MLQLACARGHLGVAQWLHDSGHAHLTAVDSKGWTALHLAADKLQAAAVSWLLEKGADPLAREDNGRTALQVAAAAAAAGSAKNGGAGSNTTILVPGLLGSEERDRRDRVLELLSAAEPGALQPMHQQEIKARKVVLMEYDVLAGRSLVYEFKIQGEDKDLGFCVLVEPANYQSGDALKYSSKLPMHRGQVSVQCSAACVCGARRPSASPLGSAVEPWMAPLLLL